MHWWTPSALARPTPLLVVSAAVLSAALCVLCALSLAGFALASSSASPTMYNAPYGFANPGGPAAFNTPPPQQMQQQPPQPPPQQQMPPGSMPGQPQQMMYGQPFGMPGGQGQFMPGGGNPNMMGGSPGPGGMMQNPGMPHMGANGQSELCFLR